MATGRLAIALVCCAAKPPLCIASSRHCDAFSESAQLSPDFEDAHVSMLQVQVQRNLLQSGIVARTNVSHSMPAAVDDVWHCLCGGWAGADLEGTIWADAIFAPISAVDVLPGAPEGRHRVVGGMVFETLINVNRTAHTCQYQVHMQPEIHVNVIVSESSTPGVATVNWSDHAECKDITEAASVKADRLSTYAMFADLALKCASAK